MSTERSQKPGQERGLGQGVGVCVPHKALCAPSRVVSVGSVVVFDAELQGTW